MARLGTCEVVLSWLSSVSRVCWASLGRCLPAGPSRAWRHVPWPHGVHTGTALPCSPTFSLQFASPDLGPGEGALPSVDLLATPTFMTSKSPGMRTQEERAKGALVRQQPDPGLGSGAQQPAQSSGLGRGLALMQLCKAPPDSLLLLLEDACSSWSFDIFK